MKNKKAACKTCGYTLNDIVSNSKLGCPKCYEHYREELLPVFIVAHKAMLHVGKKPKFNQHLSLKEQINILKLKLSHAIEQEKYEEANLIKIKLEELIC